MDNYRITTKMKTLFYVVFLVLSCFVLVSCESLSQHQLDEVSLRKAAVIVRELRQLDNEYRGHKIKLKLLHKLVIKHLEPLIHLVGPVLAAIIAGTITVLGVGVIHSPLSPFRPLPMPLPPVGTFPYTQIARVPGIPDIIPIGYHYHPPAVHPLIHGQPHIQNDEWRHQIWKRVLQEDKRYEQSKEMLDWLLASGHQPRPLYPAFVPRKSSPIQSNKPVLYVPSDPERYSHHVHQIQNAQHNLQRPRYDSRNTRMQQLLRRFGFAVEHDHQRNDQLEMNTIHTTYHKTRFRRSLEEQEAAKLYENLKRTRFLPLANNTEAVKQPRPQRRKVDRRRTRFNATERVQKARTQHKSVSPVDAQLIHSSVVNADGRELDVNEAIGELLRALSAQEKRPRQLGGKVFRRGSRQHKGFAGLSHNGTAIYYTTDYDFPSVMDHVISKAFRHKNGSVIQDAESKHFRSAWTEIKQLIKLVQTSATTGLLAESRQQIVNAMMMTLLGELFSVLWRRFKLDSSLLPMLPASTLRRQGVSGTAAVAQHLTQSAVKHKSTQEALHNWLNVLASMDRKIALKENALL